MSAAPWRAVLLLAGCLAVGCGEVAHEHAPLPDPASAPVLAIPDPDWSVRRLDGGTTRLGDLAGDVVFVNLWATWCSPCVQEMPSIQALADAFAGEAVRFLLVSDEDAETVRRFAELKQFSLPFGHGLSGLPEAFDSGGLIPATFILDRRGRMVVKHVGFRDWNAPAVHEFVRGLLDVEA